MILKWLMAAPIFLPGQQHHGHCLQTSVLQWDRISIMSKCMTAMNTIFLLKADFMLITKIRLNARLSGKRRVQSSSIQDMSRFSLILLICINRMMARTVQNRITVHSAYSMPISFQQKTVQALFIQLQASVKTITKFSKAQAFRQSAL